MNNDFYTQINGTKLHENTDKWRPLALHFKEHKCFTKLKKGTLEYKNFWKEQRKRCIYGYRVDDDWITGYHYFYLNFSPILVVTPKKDKDGNIIRDKSGKVASDRHEDFPSFWDGDYDYFHYLEKAESGDLNYIRLFPENKLYEAKTGGSHGSVLKTRGRGYSFKAASMCNRNYSLIKKSKSYVLASEKAFLTDNDGILTKAWDIMGFVDTNTPWGRRRVKHNTPMHKKSSYMKRGDENEYGFKSEIIGVTLKNDVQKARGLRGKLILFEEAGKFPDILTAWTICRKSVEESNNIYGLMLAFGTGGTVAANFEGLEELFYNPRGYNILPCNNIWKEAATNEDACSFFMPDYINAAGSMDEQGNSLIEQAKVIINDRRENIKKYSKDKNALLRECAEAPIIPEEATLRIGNSWFNPHELRLWEQYLTSDKKLQNVGTNGFVYRNKEGNITFRPDSDMFQPNFPEKKGENREGCVTLYWSPCKINGKIPDGIYYACLPENEKVLTNRGLINIQDVSYEDKLIDKDGNYTSIIKKMEFPATDEDIYQIRTSNNFRTTSFTEEHPIYVSDSKFKINSKKNHPKYKFKESYSDFNFNFIPCKDVKKGQWVKVPNIYRKEEKIDLSKWTSFKGKGNKFIMNPLEDKDFWWFVGLWLGDGYCTKNTYETSISFNSTEKEYINKLVQLSKRLFNRKAYVSIRGSLTIVSIDSKSLSSFLTSNFDSGAANKNLPEWVKYINHNFKKKLLSGYLASDGCITKQSGYYSLEYVSISLLLLESMQDIALSLGLMCGITKLRNASTATFKGKLYKTKETYHLRFGQISTLLFAEMIKEDNDIKINKIDFNNIKGKHRIQKAHCFFDESLDYFYTRIKEIKKYKYTGTVYNFETTTNTFMCRHITTHNCADPYGLTTDAGESLGVIYILCHPNPVVLSKHPEDCIVASYIGRPHDQDEWNRIAFMLAEMYNAKITCENDRGNMVEYAKNHRLLKWLEPEFGILGKSGKIYNQLGRGYGVSISGGEKKVEGLQYLNDWLFRKRAVDEKGNHTINLHLIFDINLVRELRTYDIKANRDRVSALIVGQFIRRDRIDRMNTINKPSLKQQLDKITFCK